MKPLITTLLVSFAAIVRGNEAANTIPFSTTAWNLDDPSVSLTGDRLTLTYASSGSSLFKPGENLVSEFYSSTCKGSAEYVIPNGAITDNGVHPYPSMNDGNVMLGFDVDTTAVVSDENLYDGANYKVTFCVRTMLGYGGDEAIPSLSYAEQETYGFQEVNFIETIIEISYDLESDFGLSPVTIESEPKVATKLNQSAFALAVWLCDLSDEASLAEGEMPPPIPITQKFSQGSLISVCVAPEGAPPNLKMSHIDNFVWKRQVGVLSGNIPEMVEQYAVQGGTASPDKLSTYLGCLGEHYCSITTLIKAAFYQKVDDGTDGQASGTGLAVTMFSRRRLGAEYETDANDRLLQGESIEEENSFAIVVDLNTDNDRPGDFLKTSDGVSVGFTALTSLIAQAGLLLLA